MSNSKLQPVRLARNKSEIFKRAAEIKASAKASLALMQCQLEKKRSQIQKPENRCCFECPDVRLRFSGTVQADRPTQEGAGQDVTEGRRCPEHLPASVLGLRQEALGLHRTNAPYPLFLSR
jgi:hypothetical protein